MPKPVKHPWPAGMIMVMPVIVGVAVIVEVTQATGGRLRIAHNAQDVRLVVLQHIDNNHPNATAKDPQNAMSWRRRASEAVDAGVGQRFASRTPPRRPEVAGHRRQAHQTSGLGARWGTVPLSQDQSGKPLFG